MLRKKTLNKSYFFFLLLFLFCQYAKSACFTPTVTATPDLTICLGNDIALTASGAFTYEWMPNIGLNTTTGSVVRASPAVTTTYTVIGYTGIGVRCDNDKKVMISVLSLPVITNSTDASICAGSSVELTAGGAGTYEWRPSSRLDSDTGANVRANPTTAITYTVTGTTGRCSNTGTVALAILPQPVIIIIPHMTVCLGTRTILTAHAVGTISYHWSPITSLSDSTGDSVEAFPETETEYVVTASDENCSNTDSVTISLLALPNPTISSNKTICSGSCVTLTASGASTYNWSPSTGLNMTTGASVIACPSSTITYTVVGFNGNGCKKITTVTVTVAPLPTAEAGPNATILVGFNVTIGGSPTASGGTPPYAYQWVPSAGLSCNTCSNPVASPTVTTMYHLTVTDKNGCTATDSVKITVTYYFAINTIGVDTIVSDSVPVKYQLYGAGISTTTVTGTEVNYFPVLPAVGNFKTLHLNFFTLGSADSSEYLFNIDFVARISNVKAIVVDTMGHADTLALDTLYYKIINNRILAFLKAGNTYEEQNIISAKFLLEGGLMMSPNGDGLFDVFAVQGLTLADFPNYNLSILDMNGNVLFQSADPISTWNGIDAAGIILPAGSLVPQGNYQYIIDLGCSATLAGQFTIAY